MMFRKKSSKRSKQTTFDVYKKRADEEDYMSQNHSPPSMRRIVRLCASSRCGEKRIEKMRMFRPRRMLLVDEG